VISIHLRELAEPSNVPQARCLIPADSGPKRPTNMLRCGQRTPQLQITVALDRMTVERFPPPAPSATPTWTSRTHGHRTALGGALDIEL
jgi:hypothetical protein